jgi:hypothetical protein
VNFTTFSVPTQNIDILLSSLHEIHNPDSLEVLFVLAHISSPKVLIQHLECRVCDCSGRASLILIRIDHFNFRMRD